MKRSLSLFFIITVLFIGCQSNQLIIPYVPPVKQLKGQNVTSYPIYSEACGFQLLFFIPIGTNNRQSEAYYKLTWQASGGIISQLRMEESWYYGLVGTGYCTKFFATATRAN